MGRGRRLVRVAGCGLGAGLALGASGCAPGLIGGAVAGGAAAGYAYYKGAVPFDLPTPFHPTWVATLVALQDLSLPVVHYNLNEDHGEIQSRAPDGEAITLYVETVTAGAPVTRVHVRVGVFGD